MGSVGLGLLFDAFFTTTATSAAANMEHDAWWAVASGAGLSLLLLRYAVDDGRRWWKARKLQKEEGCHLVVPVGGMTCGGCVSKLEKALLAADGIQEASVTLDPAQAIIHGSASPERIHELIEQSGFQVLNSA